LLTGGGHGTGLFAAIALSPGSLFGDNAFALTGVLFWLLLGALLTQPLSAKRRIAALLLLLLHYGAALFWALQPGPDGFAGLQRMTNAAMAYVVVFAVVYLLGQLAFWRIILMPHKAPGREKRA
jgi:hypothetical protein